MLKRLLLCAGLLVPLWIALSWMPDIRDAQAQAPATNTPSVRATDDIDPTPQPSRSITSVTPDERTEGQRLAIVALNLETTAHTLERLTVNIMNISDSVVSGRVWYLLSPFDSEAEPWETAVFVAEPLPIENLDAGSTTAITFPAPEGTFAGEYALSVWVHQTVDQSEDSPTEHADGFLFPEPLVIGAPLFVTTDQVDVFVAPDDQNLLFVTFTIWNNTPNYVEVAFSYTLAPPDIPEPWVNGIFSRPFESLIVLPNQRLTLTTRDRLMLPDGALEVITWLHEDVGGERQYRSNASFRELVARP